MKAIYVIFFSAVLLLTNCKPKADEADVKKVTQLENLVSNIEDNLSFDDVEIARRVDSIKLMLGYLSQHKHDSGDVETRGAMTRYVGVQKNYEKYLQEYSAVIFDLDNYKAQIQTLRTEIEEGKIYKPDIEDKYIKLKNELVEMDKHVAELSYNTFSVEGDYRRSHEKVKKLYNYVKSREQ